MHCFLPRVETPGKPGIAAHFLASLPAIALATTTLALSSTQCSLVGLAQTEHRGIYR